MYFSIFTCVNDWILLGPEDGGQDARHEENPHEGDEINPDSCQRNIEKFYGVKDLTQLPVKSIFV